jgi:hypothetical protein
MTVTNQTNKTRQSGDGVTTTFNFSFKIFNETDLKVYKINTSTTPETETLQTITTDYTVTISTTSEGGSVTYTTAPTSNEDAFIKRVVAFTQETDIGINVNFPETAVENELDKSRMLDIQVDEATDRTLQVNQFYNGSADFTIPNPEASKVIGWDATGLVMANYSGSNLDTILTTAYGQTLVQSADAEAARDTLELGTTDDVEFAKITGSSYVGLPFASNAETAAGSLATKSVTPASLLSLFSAGSQSASGYARIPMNISGAFDEVILQWGEVTLSGTGTNLTVAVTFPITFPNAVFYTAPSMADADPRLWNYSGYSSLTTAGVTFRFNDTEVNSYAISETVKWFAIGY